MTSADVNLVKVGYSAVSCGGGDVFELDVHVVFGWSNKSATSMTEKMRNGRRLLGDLPSSNFPRYT